MEGRIMYCSDASCLYIHGHRGTPNPQRLSSALAKANWAMDRVRNGQLEYSEQEYRQLAPCVNLEFIGNKNAYHGSRVYRRTLQAQVFRCPKPNSLQFVLYSMIHDAHFRYTRHEAQGASWVNGLHLST
jgi:hypothetical protein